MYKNNSRDSNIINGCSPLKLPCNLPGKCCYFYTNPL
jgi:hypothetical protein